MELKGKTILITGGTSGIGLEAAKQFLEKGVHVIITGRNQAKLDAAKAMYPGVIPIKSDVASEEEAKLLFKEIEKLGGIDILYNNAGVGVEPSNLGISDEKHLQGATYEMNINYLGVIRLNNLFLNMMKSRPETAIINTTSLLSYVPSLLEATYSSSKTALAFYTTALRAHLGILKSHVKVFELVPPLVATAMTVDRNDPKLSPEELVKALVAGLEKDRFHIRVGSSKLVYILNRIFPKLTFNLVNPKKINPLLKS